jgi:DNA-binding NarL/FixJ family response regulator
MGSNMDSMRIVVPDDHRVFRDGVRAMLRCEGDVELVGEAETGDTAIAAVAALQPDVVLMDLGMPGKNGIEAVHLLLLSSPHMRVLVLAKYGDDDSLFEALRAGVRGYALKGADKAEILRAVRAVASGEAIVGPAIAQRLIRYFALLRPPMAQVAFPVLTDREREVLARIAWGWSNQNSHSAVSRHANLEFWARSEVGALLVARFRRGVIQRRFISGSFRVLRSCCPISREVRR